MKALKRKLHVMLFSDNVPIEKELELKTYAKENNLLVMGPDSGTAIINGVPLAFANVVNRGDIGIVAASGTGLQEVTSIISNMGAGISQAIGTGGRDVKKDIGGIMFIESIKALNDDSETKVILLVSKPPHKDVLEKIGATVKGLKKPVIAVFIGADPETVKKYNVRPASSLEEGALFAAALSKGSDIDQISKNLSDRDAELKDTAKKIAGKLNKNQKYLRALFTGGTFCSETQILLNNILDKVYSNAPTGKSEKLSDSWKSEKHTIVDLGEDEFTVGKPHPMIDFSTRNERIIDEVNDPETAVILLDNVLGYGSNLTPLPDFLPTLEKANQILKEKKIYIPMICSVTGTDKDPQSRTVMVNALEKAGLIIVDSNAAASMLSGYVIQYAGDSK
jgi:succinyl-CoA synthetase alpha subunit